MYEQHELLPPTGNECAVIDDDDDHGKYNGEQGKLSCTGKQYGGSSSSRRRNERKALFIHFFL